MIRPIDTGITRALAPLADEVHNAITTTPVRLGHSDGVTDLTGAVTARCIVWAAREVAPLLNALRVIYQEADTARAAGDDHAAAWLREVWAALPLPVRAAAGDRQAADALTPGDGS